MLSIPTLVIKKGTSIVIIFCKTLGLRSKTVPNTIIDTDVANNDIGVIVLYIFAIVTIALALVFYTTGVFGERKSKSLTKKHVITFWLGLLCDTIGTLTMSSIAKSGSSAISAINQAIHGVTGFLAIVLMIFHAVWSTLVLYQNDEKKKETFHKFSITVWLIWLIPYVVGMVIGMSH